MLQNFAHTRNEIHLHRIARDTQAIPSRDNRLWYERKVGRGWVNWGEVKFALKILAVVVMACVSIGCHAPELGEVAGAVFVVIALGEIYRKVDG